LIGRGPGLRFGKASRISAVEALQRNRKVPRRKRLALFSGLRAGNQSHFRPQVLE